MHTTLIPFALSAAVMAAAVLGSLPARAQPSQAGPLDTLTLGNAASEQAHGLIDGGSRVVAGALGETTRILLPREPQGWEGGSVSFTMAVDPVQPTYFTIRLWGSEINENRLLLLCEGKQIGYRHLGDVDLLDQGTDQPAFNGRFYYTTTPLPLDMTKGKTLLHFQIVSNGRIWGYGTTFEQYQKPMTAPTRGIYRVYTHTDGAFVPPAGEKQGEAPVNPPVRTAPGPEVLDALKARVNHEAAGEIASANPLNQMQMQFLARAYHVAWTPAYQNPQVVAQITRGLDALYVKYQSDPKTMQEDPSTPNPGWFGFGPAGEAVWQLGPQLQLSLNTTIDDGAGGKVSRRAAWAQMLRASADWNSRHRKQYSNQSMIVDMNIALANRGALALDPAQALPAQQTLHYLYQSVGLEPWLGSETDHGPDRSQGDHYYQLTAQGLTKELGFVGYYGEVLDWVTSLYDATRPAPGQPGDPKIKAQLIKIARARSVFRAPMLDADGNRAMRIEAVVGWRDEGHYPGDVAYGERPSWDASALYMAAATLDPYSVGYARQMLADGQFFASVQAQMDQNHSLRVTAGLLGVPDQYAALLAQPPSRERLPMTPGRGDFAWADPEDGVVAVKYGNEVFYASLYWRARNGINNLARVHDTLPSYDRIAVVRQDEKFEPSGLTFHQPDEINGQGLPWLPHYPIDTHSAHAGEEQPIARIPPGITFKPGDESPYAGRAAFYHLRYGNFLIGMNATTDKTFALTVPPGLTRALDLMTGKTLTFHDGSVNVAPGQTVVLAIGS